MTGLAFGSALGFADVRGIVTRQYSPGDRASIKAYRFRRDVEKHAAGCVCRYRQGDSCAVIRQRVPWSELDD